MKKNYRVRDELVVRLGNNKTYLAGEQVELTEEEFEVHSIRVETEEQYQARVNPPKSTKTEAK